MLAQIELFCHGFATVVESVLLLVMLDRVNRPLVTVWIRWLAAGAWAWHAGNFVHVLLRPVSGQLAVLFDSASMIIMAGGLLLLPCAILHGAVRLQTSGSAAFPKTNYRLLLLYLPMLLLLPAGAEIVSSGSRDFMLATQAFGIPYLIWLTIANLSAAGLFLKQQRRLTLPGGNSVLKQMSACLVVLTGLAVTYTLLPESVWWKPGLRLVAALSPLIPTFVFAWHLLRQRLLPLVLERTLVYGAVLVALLWLHRLTVSPIARMIGDDLNLDLLLLEAIVVVLLILAWQPLRTRVSEALRYLFGQDITRVRDATHQLSVEMSRRAAADPAEIADWFVHSLQQSLNVEYTWLCVSGPVSLACAAPDNWLNQQSADQLGQQTCELTFEQDELWHERAACSRSEVAAALQQLDAAAVFRIRFRDLAGWLLVGLPTGRDRISSEQLHALGLLADQFAATLYNRHLEAARQTAERRAMQQEKLSVLGLLAGSLAHEIKNPLSSMRTIATLLQEDLGPGHAQTRDVSMIVAEIDRLNATTRRLLEFARPADQTAGRISPDQVIERLLHILAHLARQHHVVLTQQLNCGQAEVAASEATLSEIMFNLIKNAIEAAGRIDQPEVCITTACADGNVMLTVTDNGGGIEPEVRDHIFEPFVSDKADGTGLGLYLVKERVRELQGDICCAQADHGRTTFEVRLPQLESAEYRARD